MRFVNGIFEILLQLIILVITLPFYLTTYFISLTIKACQNGWFDGKEKETIL
jgi:hypothetical protein